MRARAARDLADLDYRRAVQADPATQTEAARRLGTSQANISKLRARAAEPIRFPNPVLRGRVHRRSGADTR